MGRKQSSAGGRKKHWSLGLLDSMEDPARVVRKDDKVVAITDKYPKARYHYLVIPREDIPGVKDIVKKHESLLEHMHKVGKELAEQHKDYTFQIGFHSVPTMYRLHLHVISTDFDSPGLKNKYHWNSFVTPFFLPIEDIIKQLKENGEMTPIDLAKQEEYINTSIACHKCSYVPKNMPDLKKHIIIHAPEK